MTGVLANRRLGLSAPAGIGPAFPEAPLCTTTEENGGRLTCDTDYTTSTHASAGVDGGIRTRMQGLTVLIHLLFDRLRGLEMERRVGLEPTSVQLGGLPFFQLN